MDGCRAGWIAVSLWDGDWQHCLIRDSSHLLKFCATVSRLFIDIPIGLADDCASRTCDRLLRQRLGTRYSSSVFNPPIRAAVYASSYPEACSLNAARTSKKISKQSWNIVAKIRQIDELLVAYPTLRQTLFESHPELLFFQLNQAKTLLHKKRTLAGQEERLALLASAQENATLLFEEMRRTYLKRDMTDDDILDALVLAFSARRSLTEGFTALPNPPERDSQGIPMAIHFARSVANPPRSVD